MYMSVLLYYVCVCVCVSVCACSMYSRTIALFGLMFLLTKPTLNKVYCTLLCFTLPGHDHTVALISVIPKPDNSQQMSYHV